MAGMVTLYLIQQFDVSASDAYEINQFADEGDLNGILEFGHSDFWIINQMPGFVPVEGKRHVLRGRNVEKE
jgi:hypothetical protein